VREYSQIIFLHHTIGLGTVEAVITDLELQATHKKLKPFLDIGKKYWGPI
jgi:hypothetical protein